MLGINEYYGFDYSLGGGININNKVSVLLQFKLFKKPTGQQFR